MRYILSILVIVGYLGFVPAYALEGDVAVIKTKLERHKIDKKGTPGRKLLNKEEAEEYIGDLKERLLNNVYTADLLKRKMKSIKGQRLVDGIIFNTGGGMFGYLKRVDGQYKLIFDTEGGRQYRPVTEASIYKYLNSIQDEDLYPYVIFDKEGNEAAILYLPWGVLLKQKFTDKDNVYIEFKVR